MLKKTIGLFIAFIIIAWLPGCAQLGYTTDTLHYDNIETVFIEMFDNNTFRRGVEYDLTRAVATQLELHTPYKVVSNRNTADTILSGNILGIAERVLTEQRDLDRPLENQVTILVEVTWKDFRNGQLLLDHRQISTSGEYVSLLAAGRDSATQEAANEMAVYIVEAMERPW
ncbi:MAG: LptE family protein [Sedimentisphaerales bacterium]|nr:LptE family protein [Sedimentisphaerales bacterium]